MFKHLLVAIDGSDHADHAIEIAADLAMRYHAKLTILHVARHPHVVNTLIDLQELERIEHVDFHEQDVLDLVAAKVTADAEKRVRELGVPDVEVVARRGNRAQQIIEHAGDVGVDLIVMGTRGLSDLPASMLGSVSHKVIHLSDVPVLAVR